MAKKSVRDSSARPPPHMRAWKVGTTKATTQTTTTQDEVATVKKSLRDTRVDFRETAKVQKVQTAPLSRRPQEPSDFLILYSLVRDRVLPQGFGEAFSGLEQAANLAADRQDIHCLSCLQLAVFGLDPRTEQTSRTAHEAREDSHRPVLACSGQGTETVSTQVPTRSVPRPERQERGRGNRTDEVDRTPGSMLAHTPTPMGTLLAAPPSNLQLLGAGRRAATLRSRVRAVKRFLDWLAVSHAKGYPNFTTTRDTFRHASQSHAHEER